MNRYSIFVLVVAVAAALVAGYSFFSAESYGGRVRAVTIEAGSMVAGDPDEPTAAQAVACGTNSVTRQYGWPFTTTRGSSTCTAQEKRLTIYPSGIVLNAAIAGVIGLVTYLIMNKIRRQN